MKNIIAIDFGERYIGLALKRESLSTPYPLKILDTQKIQVLNELKSILIEHNIDEIIIGYPIGLNNHQTRMSKVVDEFIENDLKSITNIPIHKIDERMTSKIINDNSTRNDDLAALEILISYIKK